MRKDETVRVLGIDPGSNEMGWGVLEYRPLTNKVYVIGTGMIYGEKLFREHKKQYKGVDKLFSKMMCLYDAITKVCELFGPDHFASESGFAGKFAQVIIVITQVNHTIRRAVYDLYGKNVTPISPKKIKVDISNKGDASKDKVRDSVINNDQLVFECDVDPTTLAEHQYDGIACAFSLIKTNLDLLKV